MTTACSVASVVRTSTNGLPGLSLPIDSHGRHGQMEKLLKSAEALQRDAAALLRAAGRSDAALRAEGFVARIRLTLDRPQETLAPAHEATSSR